MTVPTVDVSVTVKPAWINRWFHALFTRPGVEIDGLGYELRWGVNHVEVPISAERIGVYFHYRGTSAQRLALTEDDLHSNTRNITAKLGIRNSASFVVSER
nr:hypothetical protein [Rhodococcus sp. (in: high G+C Gram-positive bacteria)]